MTWDIEALFDQAASLSPDAKARFLANLREEYPVIGPEVESLLAHAPGAAERLSGLVDQAGSLGTSDAGEAGIVGQTIGAYLIVRHIASGGMGSVYEAVRGGDYHKRVALKLSHIRDGSPDWIAQLERERQILADLDHPNIARLLDGGTTRDGRPYLVMEYIDGQPITRYVQALGLSIRERIEVFRKVCAAVAYANEHLVVHRDLKPDNILVSEDGEPRLLDFGIAKLLLSDGASNRQASTLLFLSLAYCSPEQARAEPVTTRSDVYSLAMILYEMLTGREARGLEQINAPDMRAAAADPAELSAPELDSDLDTIIRMATRPEPAQRYSSVRRLSDDLGRFLAGLPIEAKPATWRYLAVKFIGRHRALVAVCLVAALALTAGAGAFVWQARRAERRFALARRLANVVLTDIHDRVNAVPGAVELRSRVSATAVEYMDALSKEAGSDADLRLELAAGYARLAASQGGVASRLTADRAFESANRGLVLLEGVPAAHVLLARAIEADLRLQRAQALSDNGRIKDCIADLQRVIEISPCEAGNERQCRREFEARYHLVFHASALREFDLAGENLRGMRFILEKHGPSWPEQKRLWELYAAAREMRLIIQRDRDPAAAVRVGNSMLPAAEELAASSSGDAAVINALLRFYNYYSSALTNDKSAPVPRKAQVAHRFWHVAQKLHAIDPSDNRAQAQLGVAADRLGWLYQSADPVRSAEWFEKSLELFLVARAAAGGAKLLDVGLREAGEEAIRSRLRAGHRDKAVQTALQVSHALDPNAEADMKLPRSPVVQKLQALWFAAAMAEGIHAPDAPALWRMAREQADLALSGAPNDPMMLAVCAAIFDRWPGPIPTDAYGSRAAQLWQQASIAVPDSLWVRKRLDAHGTAR